MAGNQAQFLPERFQWNELKGRVSFTLPTGISENFFGKIMKRDFYLGRTLPPIKEQDT